jgi:hypothetical protein
LRKRCCRAYERSRRDRLVDFNSLSMSMRLSIAHILPEERSGCHTLYASSPGILPPLLAAGARGEDRLKGLRRPNHPWRTLILTLSKRGKESLACHDMPCKLRFMRIRGATTACPRPTRLISHTMSKNGPYPLGVKGPYRQNGVSPGYLTDQRQNER